MWDSPGVEQFNFAYILLFKLSDYVLAWNSAVEGFEQRFGIFGSDVEFMSINGNAIHHDCDPYYHMVAIYAIDEDWKVIDELCYKEGGKISDSIRETFTKPQSYLTRRL